MNNNTNNTTDINTNNTTDINMNNTTDINMNNKTDINTIDKNIINDIKILILDKKLYLMDDEYLTYINNISEDTNYKKELIKEYRLLFKTAYELSLYINKKIEKIEDITPYIEKLKEIKHYHDDTMNDLLILLIVKYIKTIKNNTNTIPKINEYKNALQSILGLYNINNYIKFTNTDEDVINKIIENYKNVKILQSIKTKYNYEIDKVKNMASTISKTHSLISINYIPNILFCMFFENNVYEKLILRSSFSRVFKNKIKNVLYDDDNDKYLLDRLSTYPSKIQNNIEYNVFDDIYYRDKIQNLLLLCVINMKSNIFLNVSSYQLIDLLLSKYDDIDIFKEITNNIFLTNEMSIFIKLINIFSLFVVKLNVKIKIMDANLNEIQNDNLLSFFNVKENYSEHIPYITIPNNYDFSTKTIDSCVNVPDNVIKNNYIVSKNYSISNDNEIIIFFKNRYEHSYKYDKNLETEIKISENIVPYTQIFNIGAVSYRLIKVLLIDSNTGFYSIDIDNKMKYNSNSDNILDNYTIDTDEISKKGMLYFYKKN